MVDEMLWEEDRPNSKALSRKAEMVSSRARQKLNANTAGSSDGFSRPGSSQSRSLPLPRLQPPTGPLPPIPRPPPPGLSSISERHPPSVETWRSQITSSSRSVINGPPSVVMSPTLSNKQMSTTESLSDLDNELTGSIASWQMIEQMADNNSSASPTTPFTSPHVSVNYDFHKHIPNEGRPRVLRHHSSNEYRGPPRTTSHALSQMSNNGWENASTVAPSSEHSSMFIQDAINMPLPSASERQAMRNESRFDDVKTLRRATSQASSQQSSARSAVSRHSVQTDTRSIASSQEDNTPIPSKSTKRGLGFSLFPSKSRTASPLSPLSPDSTRPATARADPNEDSLPRSMPPMNASLMPELSDQGSAPEYLSLNTALQWKVTHKKVKKASKLPPLPGANLLEHLNDRDHVCSMSQLQLIPRLTK